MLTRGVCSYHFGPGMLWDYCIVALEWANKPHTSHPLHIHTYMELDITDSEHIVLFQEFQ